MKQNKRQLKRHRMKKPMIHKRHGDKRQRDIKIEESWC